VKPGDRIISIIGNDVRVAVVGHDQDWTAYELTNIYPTEGATPAVLGEVIDEVIQFGDKFGEVESYRQFPQFLSSGLRYRS
jgi:hypothetical protein